MRHAIDYLAGKGASWLRTKTGMREVRTIAKALEKTEGPDSAATFRLMVEDHLRFERRQMVGR